MPPSATTPFLNTISFPISAASLMDIRLAVENRFCSAVSMVGDISQRSRVIRVLAENTHAMIDSNRAKVDL